MSTLRSLRLLTLAAALALVGCLLQPCGKTVEKTRESKGGWDLVVECRWDREWKGHGGGRGSIATPTRQCRGTWHLKASRGGTSTVVPMEGYVQDACTVVDRTCKKTKTEVRTRSEGEVVLATARALPYSPVAVYLPPKGLPVPYAAKLPADAAAALKAMPSFDDAIEQMLTGKVPAHRNLYRALDAERVKKHQGTILARLRSCKFEHELAEPALTHGGQEAFEPVYAKLAAGEACGDVKGYELARVAAGPLCVRVEADLKRCGADCPPPLTLALATLAQDGDCAKAADLLAPRLTPLPGLDAAADRHHAWCASAALVVNHAPEKAAAPLLAALRRAPEQKLSPYPLYKVRHAAVQGCRPGSIAPLLALLIAADSPALRKGLASLAADDSVAASSREGARKVLAVLVPPDAGVPDARREARAVDATGAPQPDRR